MLSSFDLNTSQGQRVAARVRSSSGGPAGAFLTTILVGHMTLGYAMFVVFVWPPISANAVQELLQEQIR